ncbi:hypothetical protein KR222_008416 [Zaprionus bogoriensis]|nr:hypothetical protein KR222_008416 [Zaprionus bogoriensis]
MLKLYGFDLSDAGLFLGRLQLVVSAIVTLALIITLVCLRIMNVVDIFGGVRVDHVEYNLVAAVGLAFTLLFSLMPAYLFVQGVRSKRHRLMFPWLSIAVMLLTICSFSTITAFFIFLSMPGWENFGIAFFIWFLILAVGGAGYNTFGMLCLYDQIRSSNKRNRRGLNDINETEQQ